MICRKSKYWLPFEQSKAYIRLRNGNSVLAWQPKTASGKGFKELIISFNERNGGKKV